MKHLSYVRKWWQCICCTLQGIPDENYSQLPDEKRLEHNMVFATVYILFAGVLFCLLLIGLV